jgi:von Hippel-Lindau disease tumor supressor
MDFSKLATALAIMLATTNIARAEKCSGIQGLQSVEGSTSTKITFANRGKSTKLIYWINYEGKRVLYNTLRPKQTYTQQTFVTHPWVATTRKGTCAGVFLPARNAVTFTLK